MIQDDTILLPHIIADTVIQELDRYLWHEHRKELEISEGRGVELYLSERAERCYQANDRFRRQVRGNHGREHLYAFMRHWLTGWVYDNRPRLKRLIPDGFANGLKIGGNHAYD